VNLLPRVQHPPDETLGEEASNSRLFRLVDVATRSIEMAGPPEGHFARRYVPLLHGMADIIQSGHTQAVLRTSGSTSAVMMDAINLPAQQQSNKELDLWEIWQQAGLDTFWPSLFEDTYEGS
jgi:hypothetical protein